VEKSTFTPLYKALRLRLVEMRRAAKLNQRQLAQRLGREHSFVSRIELGERRLDVVEFYWVCRACGADPTSVLVDLVHQFEHFNRPPGRQQRTK
jgi:transcriptional regulator with XRE-family HTH domain